ncbi:hypothetical protein JWG45_05475 [Leptospira sp. 201903070]|uniref:PF14238 domain protein n=1 Tax=Leptospira ainlahdjerensis TaxID=2810033 RepID=A0ABS2U8A2_9LEPT|nr:hypothetical protein [Leptospira ainlahdjerensis]MBM9576601.1 hypothetical protein [Leptospira ainlahdjerensis]
MRRGILFVLALVFLVASFFLLEEKKEDQTEISFWDIDIDEIEYLPPKSSWNAEDAMSFYPSSIVLKKEKTLSETGLFISVKSIDLETGASLVFEGGYNAENLFRELSVLKVKGVETVGDEKDSSTLKINEGSPEILLRSSGKSIKKIFIGKKKSSDSTRIIKEGNNILITQSHILDRFARGIGEFRQRQIVNLKDEFISETIWEEEGITLRLDNHPFKEENVKKNFWRRLSGKIVAIEPYLGDTWNNQIIGQRVDLYPDDPNGAGFAVAKSLTSVPAESSLKLRLSNGDWITIRYYPKTNINSVDYRPAIRILNDKFSEPPFYIREDSFLRIKENAGNLDKAEQKKPIETQNAAPKSPTSAFPKK